MSTTSPILGLTVPTISDQFSTTVVAGNWNLIDASPGIYFSNAASPPSWGTGQAGRIWCQKDNELLMFWTGTGFIRLNPTGHLGHAQSTSPVTNALTSPTTAVTVTCTVPPSPRQCKIEAMVPSAVMSAGTGTLGLYVDSTLVQTVATLSTAAVPLYIMALTVPSAGSHAFALKVNTNSTSNTLTMAATATSPITINVIEM